MLVVKNLYNNLAKPFTTVCSDPFYGQTSVSRPPNFSEAACKHKIATLDIFKDFFLDFF
jgi:hypothetical protein